MACYTLIALIEFLTFPKNEETNALDFAWPAKSVLRDSVGNGSSIEYSNGHVKKAKRARLE